MSVLTVVCSGVAVHPGVYVPAVVLDSGLVAVARLRALLDRVSSFSGGQPLTGLDPSHLVDPDLGLRWVLDVDLDQGWVK